MRREFESRYLQLHKRLTALRTESEEVWKPLENAESSLMEIISGKDYDLTPLFAASGASEDDRFSPPAPAPKLPEAALLKMRSDRQNEDLYFYVNSVLCTCQKYFRLVYGCVDFIHVPLPLVVSHLEKIA